MKETEPVVKTASKAASRNGRRAAAACTSRTSRPARVGVGRDKHASAQIDPDQGNLREGVRKLGQVLSVAATHFQYPNPRPTFQIVDEHRELAPVALPDLRVG